MSLPKYGKYSDSGVRLLATIPAHWEIHPFKLFISFIESGVSVNSIDDPVSIGEVGVLKTSCVSSGSFNPSENKTVVIEELERVACSVKEGTLIVSRMNTPELVGAAGLVYKTQENLFLPDRLWQVHLSKMLPKFAYYWTAGPLYRAQVQMACAGTSASMQNLSQEDFLRFILPMPPVDEQTAIAVFLDRETAKIDALIDEQERLINLLAEKRQATIFHAVTRGLNPNATMKDSGVAWLGEVPVHWKLKRLKQVVALVESGVSVNAIDEPAYNGGIGVLKTSCVYDGNFNPSENKQVVVEELERVACPVKAGSLIVSRMNTPALVGAAGVVIKSRDDLFLPDRLWQVHLHKNVLPQFVHYWTTSPAYRTQVEMSCAGTSASMQNLSQTDFLRFTCPIPSFKEQTAIVAFLDIEILKLDTLKSESELVIALLKERRSALISAAVSGQIDVRGLVKAQPS